jgi:3-methyladenine DNA glycosylase/8-oxoguanine DNA glycosylase
MFATNTQFTRTVSMSAAATSLGRDVGGMMAFPCPERLLALDEADMRVQLRCGFRARYLRKLCERAIERAGVYLGTEWRKMTAVDMRSELSGLLGFGPSSVDYVSRMYYPNEGYHLDSWVLGRYRDMFGIAASEVNSFIRRRYHKFGDWGSTVMWLELTKHWHEGPPPTPKTY